MVAASTGTYYGQSMTEGYVYTIAGNGTAGYSGDGGLGTDAQLRNPTSVAVNGSGDVFIADSNNNRIRYLDSSGNITTYGGTGTQSFRENEGPVSSATLSTPRGVAGDGSGHLYIADEGNHRIRMVPAFGGTFYGQAMTGEYIYTIAGTSTHGFSGDGGAPTSAELNLPFCVSVDGAGHLYIADVQNHRIRMIPATTDTHFGVAMTAGNIYAVAGTGTIGYSGDGDPATSANLSYPSGVVVGSDGRRHAYRRPRQQTHPRCRRRWHHHDERRNRGRRLHGGWRPGDIGATGVSLCRGGR